MPYRAHPEVVRFVRLLKHFPQLYSPIFGRRRSLAQVPDLDPDSSAIPQFRNHIPWAPRGKV